jgi:predicted ABC-type ATPase
MQRLYLPLADIASIYDNSDAAHILIAEREFGSPLRIHDQERWELIRRQL